MAQRVALTGIWAGFVVAARYSVTAAPGLLVSGIVAAAPMIVAAWAAEWPLHRLSSTLAGIRAGDDPAVPARRARAAFMSSLAWFVAMITALQFAGLCVAAGLGILDLSQVILSLAFMFLGCSWFAASVLAAIDRADLALTVSTGLLLATLCLIALARLEVVSADLTGPIAYLMGCLTAALALTLLAHQSIAARVSCR